MSNNKYKILVVEDDRNIISFIQTILETGGYPILITHWQSLMSNGLGTGLKVMDEVGRRITEHLSDRVEWMSFEQITDLVVTNKAEYPKPIF